MTEVKVPNPTVPQDPLLAKTREVSDKVAGLNAAILELAGLGARVEVDLHELDAIDSAIPLPYFSVAVYKKIGD